MNRWLLVLAACKSAPSEDCKIVHDDPAHAMARVSERHPGKPIEAAEAIERCLAPSGDDCERLAKILPALPAMTGGKPVTSDVASLCQAAPPQMRRCLLPSYQLAHPDQCSLDTPISLADIQPRPKQRPVVADDVPPNVVIAIDHEGVTVTGHKGTHHKAGALDFAWLEAELRAGRDPDRSDAELHVAAGVAYQVAIDAMDVAVKSGLMDVGLDTGSDVGAPDNASGSDVLASAPVIIVTKVEVTVGGKHIAMVDDLAKGSGNIVAIAAELPKDRSLAILQADAATDMGLINRIVNTAKSAGYPNIMFAVKNH